MTEHHRGRDRRYLGIALGLTLGFFVIELIGGFLTNSLALVTDAWHMLNDVFSLGIALLATWIALRPATRNKTYGYYRVEILAAFLNGILLWAVVIFIFYEAIRRLQSPPEVKSLNMLLIATAGLAANGLSALALSRSKETSLNVKGAFLHVVADTLGSLGAISAGLIMFFTGWHQVDSLISMLIGLLILYSSWRLVQDSINVFLEGAPPHIDIEALEQRINRLEGVRSVHDLHVWTIASGRLSMSCHLVIEKGRNRRSLTKSLISLLKEEFGVDHCTIQLEAEGYPKAIGEH